MQPAVRPLEPSGVAMAVPMTGPPRNALLRELFCTQASLIGARTGGISLFIESSVQKRSQKFASMSDKRYSKDFKRNRRRYKGRIKYRMTR